MDNTKKLYILVRNKIISLVGDLKQEISILKSSYDKMDLSKYVVEEEKNLLRAQTII